MIGENSFKLRTLAAHNLPQFFNFGQFRVALLILGILCLPLLSNGAASAASLSITVSVLDIEFDGTDIVDTTDPAFGSGDLAEADPLDTAVFQVDGSTVVTLTDPPDDLGLDVYIPSISPIPIGGGVGTSAPGGTFDLITSTSVPGYGLELTLGPATVLYSPSGSTFDFVFVGSVASVGTQLLPLGLEIGDPVDVTISAQAPVGSIVDSGGFLGGFTAFGSADIIGELVPEPSTALLATIAGLCFVRRRRTR